MGPCAVGVEWQDENGPITGGEIGEAVTLPRAQAEFSLIAERDRHDRCIRDESIDAVAVFADVVLLIPIVPVEQQTVEALVDLRFGPSQKRGEGGGQGKGVVAQPVYL